MKYQQNKEKWCSQMIMNHDVKCHELMKMYDYLCLQDCYQTHLTSQVDKCEKAFVAESVYGQIKFEMEMYFHEKKHLER